MVPAAAAAAQFVAALDTTATDPAALNDGYALGLAVTATVLVLAAVVAVVVLPRRQVVTPVP